MFVWSYILFAENEPQHFNWSLFSRKKKDGEYSGEAARPDPWSLDPHNLTSRFYDSCITDDKRPWFTLLGFSRKILFSICRVGFEEHAHNMNVKGTKCNKEGFEEIWCSHPFVDHQQHQTPDERHPRHVTENPNFGIVFWHKNPSFCEKQLNTQKFCQG